MVNRKVMLMLCRLVFVVVLVCFMFNLSVFNVLVVFVLLEVVWLLCLVIGML